MRPLSAAKLVIVIAATASSACGIKAITHITAYPEVAQTRSIYVADLGDAPGALEIRERISQELIRSQRFTLADEPGQADASLQGMASAAPTCFGGCFMSEVVLRLVGTKTQKVTWIFRDSCDGGIPVGADCIAESVVDHLLDDAKHAEHEVAK